MEESTYFLYHMLRGHMKVKVKPGNSFPFAYMWILNLMCPACSLA